MENAKDIDAKVKAYTATHVHIALAIAFVAGAIIGHIV